MADVLCLFLGEGKLISGKIESSDCLRSPCKTSMYAHDMRRLLALHAFSSDAVVSVRPYVVRVVRLLVNKK